jgi:hypothetical protein
MQPGPSQPRVLNLSQRMAGDRVLTIAVPVEVSAQDLRVFIDGSQSALRITRKDGQPLVVGLSDALV